MARRSGRQPIEGEDLILTEGNTLQKRPFDNITGEETGWTGYMGNWGSEATHLYRVTALVLVATGTVPVSVEDDDDENVTPGVAESGAAVSGIDVPAAAAPDVATPGVAATAENCRHIRVPVPPSRMVGAVRPSTMRNGYVPLKIVRDAVKRAREELGMNP